VSLKAAMPPEADRPLLGLSVSATRDNGRDAPGPPLLKFLIRTADRTYSDITAERESGSSQMRMFYGVLISFTEVLILAAGAAAMITAACILL